MRKIIVLLILIPLLSYNSSKVEKNIVGKWKGEDEKNQIGYMTFDDEGFATSEIEGKIVGGKEFEMNGKKGSMTYSVNFDEKPIQIDLILTLLETKEQMSMLLIAKFQEEDVMIIASNFNETRPIDFSPDNSITLHRTN
ncbi:hypothetical protein [Algibacter sp.]|uniref:hypothetical protein n=1 Tax=Algibacter sp. TaxID=1872428 RepID=UPI003C76925B